MKPKLVLTGRIFSIPYHISGNRLIYGAIKDTCLLVVGIICYEYRVQYQTEASK